MFQVLILPGVPFYLASLAALLVAIWCLYTQRPQVVGLIPTLQGWTMQRRFVIGQAAGSLIAAMILLTAFAQAAAGLMFQLMIASACAVWLYLGVVVPRKPKVAADKRRRSIRKLTPGFISYVRIALAGRDAPAVILERYTARVDTRTAPMRAVTAAALEVMERERKRPFAALRDQARLTACQELIDLAESLALAESEGASVTEALSQHERTLMAVLDDEFKRMLARRTLYLLLMSAIAVVVGIMGNILFTMVAPVIFQRAGL